MRISLQRVSGSSFEAHWIHTYPLVSPDNLTLLYATATSSEPEPCHAADAPSTTPSEGITFTAMTMTPTCMMFMATTIHESEPRTLLPAIHSTAVAPEAISRTPTPNNHFQNNPHRAHSTATPAIEALNRYVQRRSDLPTAAHMIETMLESFVISSMRVRSFSKR